MPTEETILIKNKNKLTQLSRVSPAYRPTKAAPVFADETIPGPLVQITYPNADKNRQSTERQRRASNCGNIQFVGQVG